MILTQRNFPRQKYYAMKFPFESFTAAILSPDQIGRGVIIQFIRGASLIPCLTNKGLEFFLLKVRSINMDKTLFEGIFIGKKIKVSILIVIDINRTNLSNLVVLGRIKFWAGNFSTQPMKQSLKSPIQIEKYSIKTLFFY